MNSTVRLTLITLALGLSACTVQPPSQERLPPIEAPHPRQGPAVKPLPGAAGHPAEQARRHAQSNAAYLCQLRPATRRASHWDPRMGVYVPENKTNTFYRQRTYYRWNNGWSWSLSPDGPWQETDSSGVPGGLGRAFAQ